MSFLPSDPRRFFIIKAAGENGRDNHGETEVNHGQKHHFVADNTPYDSFTAAVGRAKQLAKATPGNRYYVVEMRAGFLAHEPRFEERTYR